MKLELSNELKDQLKQCEKIGVWEVCKTTPHLSLFVPAVDYDIVPLELGRNGEMSRTVQCLLVEALEQYAENKGYWFEFYRANDPDVNFHGAIIAKTFNPFDMDAKTETAEAPTRLQAALDAFLLVDWSKDEKAL
jgi:hypothetical protein